MNSLSGVDPVNLDATIDRIVEAKVAGMRSEIQVLSSEIKRMKARIPSAPQAREQKYAVAPLSEKRSSCNRSCEMASLSNLFQSTQTHEGACYERTMLLPSVEDTQAAEFLMKEVGGQTARLEAMHVPESLFNYCMASLATSSDPWRAPALVCWIELFFVQFTVMAAFVVYNDLEGSAAGVLPPELRKEPLSDCIFAKSAFYGIPFIEYCMGIVAVLIVSTVIKSDDDDNLMAMYPQWDTRFTLWCFSRFAWFWQTVYLPGCFALEAATMFANSDTAMTIVVNTLALTFIMEIDNLLYRMLSDEEKHEYQQKVANHPSKLKPGKYTSWMMFSANLVLMIARFVIQTIVVGQGELFGVEYLAFYQALTAPCYACIYASRCAAQTVTSELDSIEVSEEVPCWQRYSSCIAKALLASVCGVLLYVCQDVYVRFDFNGFYTLLDFEICGLHNMSTSNRR